MLHAVLKERYEGETYFYLGAGRRQKSQATGEDLEPRNRFASHKTENLRGEISKKEVKEKIREMHLPKKREGEGDEASQVSVSEEYWWWCRKELRGEHEVIEQSLPSFRCMSGGISFRRPDPEVDKMNTSK